MSLFRALEATCPSCGEHEEFEAVFSVNADRRPDLRQKILDDQFQRTVCVHCGAAYRMEPEFTYLDEALGLWIVAHPDDAVVRWPVLEAEAERLFSRAFADSRSTRAADLAKTLRLRVSFGWAGLREKIAIAHAGLDDITVELLKASLIRAVDSPPLAGHIDLRFLGPEPDHWVLAWIRSPEDRVVEALRVPVGAYDAIVAAPAPWSPLRDRLDAGAFVDLKRMMLQVSS